ncbi:type II secretion system protein GspM [Xanthomonas floridensis]|uniref:Type II secretion system protein GspM n=1 Tax=Xanthomonas floridensis TaxID=1843580 RepID=A0A1A9M7F4_9XANT|nr:type II secretion system protein GspM [Xanthomonas floridensis]MEA5124031.1 type II secretion system protein GspM [Xanthomonas floridensis]MEA5131717.1 type II secretion system protein GspM [Xanthomonas floridensis]OAG65500.1 type II secretion system protein M [Xanthomonas floridensis]
MNHRMQAWWQARAPRERGMLAIMLLAVAAFVGWYALLVPLRHWKDRAQSRYDHAAEALLAARASQRAATVTAVPLERILRSAREATIAITHHRVSPTGTLDLQIDRVSSASLFAWLEQLRQRDRLAPTQLDIARRDGQLQAHITLQGIAP